MPTNVKTEPDPVPEYKTFGFGDGFQIKAINESDRTFSGMASTTDIDRTFDRVYPKGADLTAFRRDPALLANHMTVLPDGSPGRIGDVLSIDATDKGLPIKARVYDDTALAEKWWPFIARKRIRGLSIGYLPKRGGTEYTEEVVKGERIQVRHLKAWELLEISVVVTAANPNALIKLLSESGVNVTRFGDLKGPAFDRELLERIAATQADMAARIDALDVNLCELHNLVAIGPDYKSALSGDRDHAGSTTPDDDDDDDDDSAGVELAMLSLGEIIDGNGA